MYESSSGSADGHRYVGPSQNRKEGLAREQYRKDAEHIDVSDVTNAFPIPK